MVRKTVSIRPIGEKIYREFKTELRKLRKSCEDNGIKLMSYDEAELDDICIISTDEYQIGNKLSQCDSSIESYFISSYDYDQMLHVM